MATKVWNTDNIEQCWNANIDNRHAQERARLDKLRATMNTMETICKMINLKTSKNFTYVWELSLGGEWKSLKLASIIHPKVVVLVQSYGCTTCCGKMKLLILIGCCVHFSSVLFYWKQIIHCDITWWWKSVLCIAFIRPINLFNGAQNNFNCIYVSPHFYLVIKILTPSYAKLNVMIASHLLL